MKRTEPRQPIVLPGAPGQSLSSATPCELPGDAGESLLALARAAIAAELGLARATRELCESWLGHPGASFVTLTAGGSLRGCVGTLRAHRTLAEDVRANALAAAFRDPRFPPVAAEEWRIVALEVSVLSPLEPLRFTSEADALTQLRAGVDGVVLEYGHHTGTFLPQVWASFEAPADFLAHLKYKAGLPPDFWDRDLRLSRYTVTQWQERS